MEMGINQICRWFASMSEQSGEFSMSVAISEQTGVKPESNVREHR